MIPVAITCLGRTVRRNAPYVVMVGVLVTYALYEGVLQRQTASNPHSALLDFRQSFAAGEIGPLPRETDVVVPIKIETPNEVKPTKKKKKIWKLPILTMKFDGRLGNQMFEYAAIHAIARQKGMKVYLNASHALNRLFHIDENYVVREPCGGFSNVEVSCCDYNVSLVDAIENNTCQRIFGYFQSWRYFKPYIGSIRKQFTFQNTVVNKAQRKLRGMVRYHRKYPFKSNRGTCVLAHGKTHACTFIAMHVRRGDLMLPIRIKQGRLPAPKEYYYRAMDFYRRRYNNTIFIIGSDSQDWAVEHFAGPDALVSRDMLPEVDLSMLAQCNHTIMSVGTFGWWLSFLSRGTTVYYNKPFAVKSSSAEEYKRYDKDFARPGWIGMS